MKVKLLCFLVALWAMSLMALIPADYASLPLPQDPDLVHGTLPNGLKYYLVRNAKPANRIEVRLFVAAGSMQEDDDQLGLAHFVEHMAFNGTKNFPRTEMVDYLNSIGMGFHNGLNGGTGYENTEYLFKLPTEDKAKLRKGFSILADIAWQLSFLPDEIERERGVVQEEWRLGQSANQRVSDQIDKVRLAGSRYVGRNPIGTIENLKSFSHESLIRYYRDWYRPDLQTVIMVGDYDPLEMKSMVEEYFGVIPPRKNPRPQISYTVPDNSIPRAVVALDKELSMSLAQATWKKEHQRMVNIGAYYEKLKHDLFYSMFNARMHELSLQPNSPFSYAWGYESGWMKEFSASNLGAICTEGRSEEAMRTLLSEIARIRQHGYQPGEFERAKLEVIRQAETAVAEKPTQDSQSVIWSIYFPIIRGENILSEEQQESLCKEMITQISLEEVNGIVEQMTAPQNLTLSISGTLKEGAIFPTDERLLNISDEIYSSKMAAWVDTAIQEPIMDSIPRPGKISKQSAYPKSGIKKWQLSNGINVYSKQTDYLADEVLISAVSPGGKSMLSLDLAKASDLMGMYFASSGFGKFDGSALQKALAGKVVSAWVSMDNYSERISASCSPRDLELLFQLMHQMASKPRFDQQTFTNTKDRYGSFMQNSLLDPENAFYDTLSSLMYDNHPRKCGLRQVDLDAMTLEQLEQAFKDRFGDFSDFSFFIVGAFDEDLLRTYCTTYLANLPSGKRKDRIRDVGIKSFSGNPSIQFLKGESDRAFVSYATKGKFALTNKEVAKLGGLMVLVNDKLKENVRENLSGVYAISAWPDLDIYPKPEFNIRTWMGCDPQNVKLLSDATFATLDSLKKGLFDDKYVISARATLIKRYEEDINTNQCWVDNMLHHSFHGLRIDAWLEIPKYYTKLDKKSLTQAARKYLDFDNHRLSVIMLPEAKQ